MRLYLLRHLKPAVAPGICYGRSDVAVDPAVLAAALPALRARLPHGLPLYASPLQRCASLAAALGQPVIYDARLAELDFGSWEMRSWDDIGRDEVDAWSRDLLAYRPGGGENVAGMALRIEDFYAGLRASGHPEALIVCHAGSMRLLAALAHGRTAVSAAESPHGIAYGEIVIIDCV